MRPPSWPGGWPGGVRTVDSKDARIKELEAEVARLTRENMRLECMIRENIQACRRLLGTLASLVEGMERLHK